ncbi:MAG: glycosyltransferase family 2 protein, partial [Planctomycetaceae bacterium]
ENFLKRCEGRCDALLGVNGAIYAVRRDGYRPIPPQTIVDDFLIGMRLHLDGLKLIYDETALAREETPANADAEFARRARIGAGGFQSLRWLWPLLDPRRGRIALAFWSHKLLRWCCPLLLLVAVVANVLLSGERFYLRWLLVQECFYLAALAGLWCLRGRGRWRAARLPGLFVSLNAALAVGFVRWLRGTQKSAWKRTARTPEEVAK